MRRYTNLEGICICWDCKNEMERLEDLAGEVRKSALFTAHNGLRFKDLSCEDCGRKFNTKTREATG